MFTELYPTHSLNSKLELVRPSLLWVAVLGTVLLAVGVLTLALRSWLLRKTDNHKGADGRPNTSVADGTRLRNVARVEGENIASNSYRFCLPDGEYCWSGAVNAQFG